MAGKKFFPSLAELSKGAITIGFGWVFATEVAAPAVRWVKAKIRGA